LFRLEASRPAQFLRDRNQWGRLIAENAAFSDCLFDCSTALDMIVAISCLEPTMAKQKTVFVRTTYEKSSLCCEAANAKRLTG
jgi:hypothetical protein